MIHPETHLVTANHGPAPAGRPDECFYCQQKIGEEHKADCVLRKRTVLMRYSYDVVIDVPEEWSPEMIEFCRGGGSSWCAGNTISDLELRKEEVCWCSDFESMYMGEATADEEEKFDLELIH